MRTRFFKLTLPQRLTLLLVIPLFVTLSCAILVFRHHLAGNEWSLLFLLIVTAGGAAVALFAARKVTKGISTVNFTARELA